MSNYPLNTWLNPVIQNYHHYFGMTKKPVVWEVGSRDGRDGVELARRIYDGEDVWFWTNARIVAFEPNPMQADIIRSEYPEMDVLEIAASNVSGEAPFVVYHGDEGAVGSSSLRLDWKENDLESHQIMVKTERLDSLIGDEIIDIMKIDCEGWSMEVIEGIGDKLRQIKVMHVETEKWTDSNIKVKAYLSVLGFTLADETEQYGGMPDQVWVNTLIPRG